MGVRSDLEVLHALAARLGVTTGFSTDAAEVFEELGRATAGGVADYAGISHERLAAGEVLHWPCPAPEHPGTPRLFLDGFATPDGRARFQAVDMPADAEPVSEAFPFLLTTGRVAMQYQSGAQTRRIDELPGDAFVELHEDLAGRLGIEPGERVKVSTARGEAWLSAKVTDAIRPDTLFVPFHWAGKKRANSLTGDWLDPTSRMPQFKLCAARIEKVVA
jgi:assimilatory nitrate reductase catalytic subunit